MARTAHKKGASVGGYDNNNTGDGGALGAGGPGPLNPRWIPVAILAFAAASVAVLAGTAGIWESEPDIATSAPAPAPPREYGGPLWFTVGADDETQLITNTTPRAVAGPGVAVRGTARYLPAERCFTDGTRVLAWPRGSRPLTGAAAGVEPAEGVRILNGTGFTATGEVIIIAGTPGFPQIDPACAPGGEALSLTAVTSTSPPPPILRGP
ncbi:MAG: hypothetical protein ACT4PP_16520 [Sporichthyaceae bacterium]